MKTYFVANNNGDVARAALSFDDALELLNEVQADDPDDLLEWEILPEDDEDIMTFNVLININRISMAELNRRYRIPKRTMEDWKSGRRTPPEWVLTLLQIAIENQK